MPLQISYTNPSSGAPSPQAYVRIEDAQVSLKDNRATLTVKIYHNAATALAGKEPVGEPPPIELSPNELAQLKGAFEQQLYTLLKARGDYATALEVT